MHRRKRHLYGQHSCVTSLLELTMEPRLVAGWPFGQGKLEFYTGSSINSINTV